VFIVVSVYFVIDSVRTLPDTSSFINIISFNLRGGNLSLLCSRKNLETGEQQSISASSDTISSAQYATQYQKPRVPWLMKLKGQTRARPSLPSFTLRGTCCRFSSRDVNGMLRPMATASSQLKLNFLFCRNHQQNGKTGVTKFIYISFSR
jgi:hypothetical protein